MKLIDDGELQVIRESGLFDAAWYLEQYPDVARLGMEPAAHYLWLGARLGRDPSPDFNSNGYLAANADVAAAGVNPLVHYERFGREEGIKLSYGPENPSCDLPEFAQFIDDEPFGHDHEIPVKLPSFDAWKLFNSDSEYKRRQSLNARANLSTKIRISIIIPVYDPGIDILIDCLESAVNQKYDNYEIIIVDDKSKNRKILKLLREYDKKYECIKLIERDYNGHISAATNSGANIATGEFILFLDNDDMLDKDALNILVSHILSNESVDFLYSDDAKTLSGDTLFEPKFKPGWSPELLLSYCYVSHVKVVRTELFRNLGGCRLGFEGSQDHDLALRATEQARSIMHVPQILYHRRVVAGSMAQTGFAKPYSFEAGRRACEEAFRRRGVNCAVVQPEWAKKRGYGIFVPVMPDAGPSVTIIIPTKNNHNTLKRLLNSLESTKYQNYDVIVVDNMSDDAETLDYLSKINHKVIREKNSINGKFNFSEMNNKAVEYTDSEFILFLNDDTEICDGSWLSQMVGWLQLPGVGAVGARLLFPDGRVQHAGIVPSLPRNVGRTAFRGTESREFGYLFQACVTRNVAAVTAACMLTKRDIFIRCGGFDATHFGVAFNDIDYCIRLSEAGYRTVFCGEAELVHHEGSTRGKIDELSEIANFQKKYGNYNDKYYSPHLSKDSNRYDISPNVIPSYRKFEKIRVLAVSHNLRPEGAPNSALELLREIDKDDRLEISVVSPSDGPLRQKFADDLDVRVAVDLRRKKSERYNDYILRIKECMNIEAYDVVYANTALMYPVMEAAYIADRPCIWNIRESESWKSYFKSSGELEKNSALKAFSYPYRVVFVANATRERWEPLNSLGNFEVIHNAIDARPTEGALGSPDTSCGKGVQNIGGEKIVLLSMGTVCPRKAQHELILAVSKLPEELQGKISVVIVGKRDSEYCRYIEQLINKAPIPIRNNIKLIEETRETRKYWEAADIFVLNSRLESFPRVILEALSYNISIISTPFFGVSEQVQDNQSALFYKPGDLDRLVELMKKLILREDIRSRLSTNCRPTLECMNSFEIMTERYKNLFISAAFSSVPKMRN